jgi:hypothetical protein
MPGICVDAVPAIQSVATTSNTSCELTANNTPKNIAHNILPINFYAKETNIKKKALISGISDRGLPTSQAAVSLTISR